MSEPVHYRLRMSAPHSHLYELEAEFCDLPAAAYVARLPAWSPGSYLLREYARHVQDLVAETGDGEPLALRKIEKGAWEIRLPAAGSLRVRYCVYAHELTVRTSHLDGSHGFFNGTTLFLYLDERRASPATLDLELPPGWRATSALPIEPDSRAPATPGRIRFRAEDYDELVDSPVECGSHELLGFEVADPASGKPREHRIAVWGRADFDRARLVADVRKIVVAQAALFGELPYERYVFILLIAPGARGGLEHRASATLCASPFSFHGKAYVELLELFSHELFHAWNVKRIRPSPLGPFDYSREAYTRSLWIMEGVTSYYDRLTLRRAGLEPTRRYLDRVAEDWAKLLATPGRARQSLEESSFDAWIKLYRPDENSVNSTVSYYLKGSLVALLFDLAIRERSGGARSLDDVMRHLWRRWGKAAAGFADEAVQAELEAGAGLALGDLFEPWVRGHEELPFERALASVGLALKASFSHESERELDGPDGRAEGAGGVGAAEVAPAWLGVQLRSEGWRTIVAAVLEGGPAQAAGLYAGDEIIALDGFRVDDHSLKDRLASRRPGDSVRLAIFRRDELTGCSLRLGSAPRDRFAIGPRPDATVEARSAFEAWLGEPFPTEAQPSR